MGQDGSRKVLGISKVLPLERGEYRLDEEWRWQQTGTGDDGKFTGEFIRLK